MTLYVTMSIFAILALSIPSAAEASNVDQVSASVNTVIEWTFTSAKERPDPFNAVELDAVFTDPKGTTFRVPAFWAGGKSWKVRYASPLTGRHSFRTVCSDRSDVGLHGITGSVELKTYHGTNPLLRHGPVHASADHRTFSHADGTPFFWLGDTWWMSLCRRMSFPEDFDRLLDDRVKKGFTVVQIVAGLYPDMPAFDPRGANEAGYPWERATNLPDSSHNPKPTDYARINPAYFDAADRRIARLVEKGIAPCIVGAWGYHLPWMGVEKLEQHWRYVVARWGAYPVFWCVAGEANLPYYLAKGFPYDDREQVHGWTEIGRYLRKIDPFHRPTSIHPTGLGKLAARHAIDDSTLIDFEMLQTGHGDRDSLPDTVNTVRASYADKLTMPVLNSEVCYEGILGRCHDDVQRLMFWSCLLSGACGHTYGANGIWQMNQPGIPYGNSPHGGTYGPTPWSEAMNLPGSAQLGLAKKLLVSLGAEQFTPRKDVAAYAEPPDRIAWGNWIWYPEGKPNEDAPVEPRYFRKSVKMIDDHKVRRAVLRIGADDRCTVWMNGKEIGAKSGWTSPLVIDVTRLLRIGKNVLAVRAENMPAPFQKNPAGLVAALQIEFDNGSQVAITSGSDWKCSRTETAGWIGAAFDDSAWQDSMELGPVGMAPWGPMDRHESPYLQPYAAETPGGRRIVYLPSGSPLLLTKLAPQAPYDGFWWNPVNGMRSIITGFNTDARGRWRSPSPPTLGQDWVLFVRPAGG